MHCYIKEALTTVTGKILFMGDSITDDGRYVSFIEAWLRLYAPSEDISIYNLGVSSETLSGLSEPSHPFPRPCGLSRLKRALDYISPDWVVLCYGINDGIYYPFSEERFAAFRNGYKDAISIIRKKLPTARVVAMTPPPFDAPSLEALGGVLAPDGASEYGYTHPYSRYNDVMKRYGEWVISELRSEADLTIDLYTPLFDDICRACESDSGYIAGDGIHPNLHGHWIMASTILDSLFGVSAVNGEASLGKDGFELFQCIHERCQIIHRQLKEEVGHDNPNKEAYLSETELNAAVATADRKIEAAQSRFNAIGDLTTDWNGYKKQVFYYEGFEVTVVVPNEIAKGRPWVWRTEFFGAFPFADLAMLENGWHIVHIGISNLFGAQLAVDIMERFNKFIINRLELSDKAALFGFSRGGLYAISYAALHSQSVLALYLDAPVVDISSWPGGMGIGIGSKWDWERAQKAYSLSDCPREEYIKLCSMLLEKLYSVKIPTIMVAGDSDEVVPFEENGEVLLQAYENNKIPVTFIIKKGVGHHPHSLKNPDPIVEFLLSLL